MAQVQASSSTSVAADPERALAAVADYRDVRPRVLTDAYRDYRLVSGGHGDGTVASWTLQATKKRSRDVEATVAVAGSTVTETDARSSMVTRWDVAPEGAGSRVTVTTSWDGAGGVGGFFEKTFAPIGLRKIQAGVLANLARELA